MADRPLRPATDRRLGRPLPHQLPNRTRVHPSAINLSPVPKDQAYAVLAPVSRGCPPPKGRSPRVTHPSAALHLPEGRLRARLACVKPAASVRPEPGSNSHVVRKQLRYPNSPKTNPKPLGPRPAPKEPEPQRLRFRNAHCTSHLASSRKRKPDMQRTLQSTRRRPRFPSLIPTMSKSRGGKPRQNPFRPCYGALPPPRTTPAIDHHPWDVAGLYSH